MKSKSCFLLLLAALLTNACGVNKEAFKATKNVAIISIYSTGQIKNNSSLQARLLTDMRFDSLVLNDPAKKVHERFYTLNKLITDKVVDEASIIQSEAFQRFAKANHYPDEELDKFLSWGVTFVPVEGYPVIPKLKKKILEEAFAHLPPHIDAVIVIGNHFELEETGTFGLETANPSGLGKQRVVSILDFTMANRAGKAVLVQRIEARSKGKLSKNSKPEDLDALADEALDAGFARLNEYFSKRIGS